MFIKTFKKAISLLVIAMFILSLLPVGVLAEVTNETTLTTVEKAFANYNYSRYNNATNKAKVYNAKTYGYASLNGQYTGYGQFNLSGYEEILGNPSTTATMKLVPRYSSTDTSKPGINDVRALLAPAACDDINLSEMSWNNANAAGFHNTTRPALFIKSDGINNGSANTIVDVNVANLNAVLDEDYDDSTVSVWFSHYNSTVSQIYLANSRLNISYDPSEINNQEYIDTILSDIETWKDLTGEDCVTEAGLPKMYHGLNIAWESSDTNYITNDGKVYQYPEAKEVALTATFTYKGADESAQEVSATKDFVVTVEAETPVEVIIPFTNYAYSRSSASNTNDAKNVAYGVQSHSDTTARSISTGGSFEGYTQIDLKGYEEILKNPHTSVQMSLTAGFRFSGARIYNIGGYLASDKADCYNWETVTWNIADKLGMHDTENRPALFTKTDDIRKASGSVAVVDADKAALLSVLDESDTNSLVSVYLKSLPWGGELGEDETADSTIRCNIETTGLIIKYYESEIDDAAFFADIESSFAWDTITSDAQEAVVNDLPTYYKGADIVWSSGEGAVTSAGELIPSDGALIKDTITANVSYKDYSFTKEFDVTICDGKTALGTPALTVEGGKATASFSAVNGTGNDVVYKLYLATYTGDELIELVPFDFAVGKGKSADKTMDVSCPDGYKAKFFVWKSDGITPVLDATVK